VSDPSHCVRVGGYGLLADARGVAASGHHAFVADWSGLHVIDLTNPAHCVRAGGYARAVGSVAVTVVSNRIYVASLAQGLVVLPSLPNVQFTVRVEATPGVPFTLESTTSLNAPILWAPVLTTNVPAMPFDYVDFDVKLSEHAQKYYRVHQP
jgi:hypothetical protein